MQTSHKERPISPHLQVYSPQLTSILSIFHRGTGIFLAIGAPFLVWWLAAMAGGEQAYASFSQCANSLLGKLFLFGWTFSAFYHLCNGIRHLFWDIGKGFELSSLYRSGYIVLASAVLLTLLTWASVLSKVGG
jgi:succinate dehydrogenase / fumarate reductase cytochrome b subunit